MIGNTLLIRVMNIAANWLWKLEDYWEDGLKVWAKNVGGNWSNGANAGSRTVNLNNYPWNVNTNIGSRFACECIVYRAGISTEYQPVIGIQSGS